MRAPRSKSLAVGIVFLFALSGCASNHSDTTPEVQTADTSNTQETAPEQSADSEADADVAETTIPAGSYAASTEFPFPVPEGWAVLDEFAEETVGKDTTMYGSIEYPGDAKDAAAMYLDLLKNAAFDAYTYAPGEATNQASLAAEGVINGTLYLTILNFDVHADGYQRVSIHATEKN